MYPRCLRGEREGATLYEDPLPEVCMPILMPEDLPEGPARALAEKLMDPEYRREFIRSSFAATPSPELKALMDDLKEAKNVTWADLRNIEVNVRGFS